MSLSGKKIQTKPSKPLSVEETAEKLRALREKQSMWMKERETEKYSSGSKTRKDSKSSAKSGSAFSSDSSKLNGRTSSSSFSSSETKHNDSRSPYSNPRRKPLYPEPKRDHSDVISWIVKGDGQSSKNKRPPSGAGQHNRHNSTSRSLSRNGTRTLSSKSDSLASREYEASNYSTSGKSGGVGVTAQPQKLHNKRRPSSRSSVRSESGSVEDEKVTNVLHHEESSFVDDNEEVIGTHQPKTVNKDLASNIQRDLSKLQSGDIPPEMIAALADTVAERLQSLHGDQVNKRTTPLYGSQKPNAEHGMASHFCSLCNELMTPPRHTPMAVIPCGHSFCKACLRDCRKCPTCQTRINSSAVNTVLQAIIADFNAQKEKERLQQLEEQARKYVDEYQSLSMRSGALTAEAENILDTMESTTEHLMEQKKMVKKLEMDKRGLRDKMKEIQEHLEKVNVRERECQEKCTELEQSYNEEKDRLAMVEDTIKMINKSKERVKMLVQNFAPSLNLDDMIE